MNVYLPFFSTSGMQLDDFLPMTILTHSSIDLNSEQQCTPPTHIPIFYFAENDSETLFGIWR
jgi:hypothetical protein